MNCKVCGLEIFFSFCFVIAVLSTTRPTLTVFGETRSDGDNNTYDLNIFDKSYPIQYHITGSGNKVNNISAEADNATLLVNVLSQSNGRLSIELPRNIIDSKKQGDVDDRYIVFQDGQVTIPEEIKTDSQTRMLAIDFDKGTGQIEIAGSKILPEFGPLSALILAIATAGIIVASMKYRDPSLNLKR
jgi:hypothetical protein